MDTDEHRFLRKKSFTVWVIPGLFVTPSDLCPSVSICGFNCFFKVELFRKKFPSGNGIDRRGQTFSHGFAHQGARRAQEEQIFNARFHWLILLITGLTEKTAVCRR